MAISKCTKCDGTEFELKEAARMGNTKFKYQLVQCAACGGVVGALDYFNIGAVLAKIAAALKIDL
jgi:hypothetical protein